MKEESDNFSIKREEPKMWLTRSSPFQTAANRESIVPGTTARENAMRLLIAIDDYQTLGSTDAVIIPHRVAHYVGLNSNTEDYRDAIDYLVEKGLLVRKDRGLATFQITISGVRMVRWLRWFAPNRKRILWTLGLVGILTVLILVGYAFDKTVWDWLELLIVPTVLVIGAFWLNRTQRQREIRIAENRESVDRSLTQELARDAALQTYLDQMGRFMLETDLRHSRPSDDVRLVAVARTKAILGGLIVRTAWQEAFHKRGVVEFLYYARLISKDNPVISMDDMNLMRANLNWLELTGADLSGAMLLSATLLDTVLLDADLSKARLVGADLTGAKLTGADLSHANLRDAIVSPQQLRACKSLEGATLPNGQEYEDWLDTPQGQQWLKDKEGFGEAGGERGLS